MSSSALTHPSYQSEKEHHQYLIFTLANELYGVDINHVKEIIEYSEPTHVPMVAHFIRGILNLRGTVLPIIDLDIRFGQASRERTQRTCIIVVEVESNCEITDLGIIVDAVNDVVELSQEDIEPTPTFGNRIRNDFISQIGKINSRFVILLDMQHVLSVEELAQIEKINPNSI